MEGKIWYTPEWLAILTTVVFFIAFMFGNTFSNIQHKDDYKKWVCQWLESNFKKTFENATYEKWICEKNNAIVHIF